RTSSTPTPGASSTSANPSGVTSTTARSVMTRCTTPVPVRGRSQRATSFGLPSLAVCSIRTLTRRAPCTRSMAPPMPLTILPGIIQFARSPEDDTCMAPSTAASMCPPRIMPKDSAESKNDAPGRTVTVSLPALIRSASSSSSRGEGPTPRMPFSDCSTTSTPGGRWFEIGVGRPMPRLTYVPSTSSRAARAAICSRVSAMSGTAFLAAVYAAPFDPPDGCRVVGEDPDHPLDEDAGQVHLVRVQFARLHQMLDLGDGDAAGHRGQRVEVAGRGVEHQVAVAVPDGRPHEGEVGRDALLQEVLPAVEDAGLLRGRRDRDLPVRSVPPGQPALPDLGAGPGGRVERGDAGATGPQALRQRPLRYQFHLQFTAEVL